MKDKISLTMKRFFNILNAPELKILPGQIAFYFLMSFVPILALLSIISSYFVSSFNLFDIISDALPNALSSIILPLLNSSTPNVSFILILWFYLLLASNGPSSIIVASNELYKLNNPPFFKLKLKSFAMTLIMILLLLFMIFIPLLGDIIIKFIINLFNNPNIFIKYLSIYKIIKIFISFIFIYLSIKLLYIMAPNTKIKSNTVTTGAVFTTLGWIVSTGLFAFYITKIADYNLIYGNFANILILLLWLYLLAYLFVVGMAMNIDSYNINNKKKNN